MAITYSNIVHMMILLLVAGFITITFLQSALDKIFDYKGNLSFMKEQFSQTFLRSMIGIFLPVILIFELITGVVCLAGVVQLFIGDALYTLIYGFFLSGVTLLMLLFGQRVSKQYPGAASLTGYFIITLLGLVVLMYFKA